MSDIILNTRNSYNSYHTDFRLAVALNKIPNHKLYLYPKSTISKFRNTSPEQFADMVGLDYSNSFDFSNPDLPEKIDLIKKFAQSETSQKIFKYALYIKNTIISILSTYGYINSKIFGVKQKVVNVINKVRDVIGFDRAIHYFNIKKQTFYNWSKQVSLKCTSSAIAKCVKIWPNQISKSEIESIKKLFMDKFNLFRNLHSTWGFGFKNNIITLGISTFLKYVKLLKLTDCIHKYKKIRKTGLMTLRPNEAWNADITCSILQDRTKAYIYLLIDHYSKYILSWLVSTSVSSKLRKQTIEDAYKKYGNHKPKIFYSDISSLLNQDIKNQHYINLITDGGPENLGDLTSYISQPNVNIIHNIAQKDVPYSNSPIEALNKILKYQFLYFQNIPNINALTKLLEYWIPIYNNERPNKAGNYLLTPNEIYNGKTIDKTEISNRIIKAKLDRIAYNRINSCGVC